MRRIEIAVVGLGYFSQFHIEAWRGLTGCKVVAATDPNPDRRAWARDQYGIEAFADLESLLQSCDPELIDIVAPPPAHTTLIDACVKPGRTVICQKPFCTELTEAEAALSTCVKNNTKLIIHENFRFQPWYRTIKSALASGTFGAPYSARFALRPGDGRGPDAYLSRQPAFQSMTRFLIHETGVHFIDLFRWLLGDITAIYADLRRLNPAIAGEDAGVLMLDHAGGAQSTFDGNRLADHDTDMPRRTMGNFELICEAGTVTVAGDGAVRLRRFRSRTVEVLRAPHPTSDTSFGGGCVRALNAHVLAGLRDEGPLENTGHNYLPVIAAVEAAYTSAREGRKITLP